MSNKIDLHDRLLQAGYKEYKTSAYEKYRGIERGYSKKVTDNVGVKYFITCYKYEEHVHPYTHELILRNPYEFIVQFNTQEDKLVEIKLWSDWFVEDADQFFEEQWVANQYKYYDELY